MDISKVNQCNISLARLGHKKFIVSLDPPDTTPEGRLCDLFYEQTAIETLEIIDCRFSAQRARLTRLAEASAFGYSYKYQLPGDCLKVRKMVDSAGNDTMAKWVREGDCVLTDEAECYIKYTRYVLEPNLWSGLFRRLFMLRLAEVLSTAITASDKRLAQIQGEIIETVRLIKNNNASEGNETGRTGAGNMSWDQTGTE